MSINTHPGQGAILLCNYSGFKPPEMVKMRPVIVLCKPDPSRWGVCTVVPLSTSPPRGKSAFQPKIRMSVALPSPYDQQECWAKANILNTLSYERLNFFRRHFADGGRERIHAFVDADVLALIQHSVKEALSLTEPNGARTL